MNKSKRGHYIILVSLAMAYGWGWRGDYGHEIGAMFPGALAAMAICIASGRRDWWNRCAVIGFFGALGWAFGGSMSYGIVLGYTRHTEFWNAAYGFSSIFLIGAMWGAVGGAFLGLGLTEKRSALNSIITPALIILLIWIIIEITGLEGWLHSWKLIAEYDVDWAAAVSALAASGLFLLYNRKSFGASLFFIIATGWIAGFIVLTLLFGLRMTPPRSDNWAGMTGIVIALFIFLKRRKNEAAVMTGSYGGLYGGLGFSCGALFLTIGAVSGVPVDWWKIMEKFFGLIMGLGISLAALKFIRHDLTAADEDTDSRGLNLFSYASLFLIILWTVITRNLNDWFNGNEGLSSLASNIFGLPTHMIIYLFGAGLSALFLYAFIRNRRAPLSIIPAHPPGKAQLFFLIIMWLAFTGDVLQKIFFMGSVNVLLVQVSFAFLVLIISFLVLSSGGEEVNIVHPLSHRDKVWRMGTVQVILWISVPVIIFLLSYTAVNLHEMPLPGSHARF